MMQVTVEVPRAFALTVSEKKAETMCMRMPPSRTPQTKIRVEAAGQTGEQMLSFTYLGGAVTKTPDMSGEIARMTRARWMRVRRYLRELHDQTKVTLFLQIRQVKTEAIKAPLYGYISWTLRQEKYPRLCTVHHRVVLGILVHRANDHTVG